MSWAGFLVGVPFDEADILMDGIRVNAQCIVMRRPLFREPAGWCGAEQMRSTPLPNPRTAQSSA